MDNAAFALEDTSYLIHKVDPDGFKISRQLTMKKVVSDRRGSLDEENEIKSAMRRFVEDEFRRGASIPVIPFPSDSTDVPDTPRLTLVLVDPEAEWTSSDPLLEQIAARTSQRGKSPRLYPASLVWCIKKPGRELREKVELMLAWKRVAREVTDSTLGGEVDRRASWIRGQVHGLCCPGGREPWLGLGLYWQFDSGFIVYDTAKDRWVEPMLNALIAR